MNASREPGSRCAVLIAMCVALFVLAAPARAVDVSQLSDFENDPCVLALSDRNTAQHVDAPDSALVDACDRAHGSAEVAWDFLTRTWLPRDVTATAIYGPSAPIGMLAASLAVLEMLLAYAVLGAPVRVLAVALRPAPPGSSRPRRVAAQAGLCLAVRLLAATILLRLLALPMATVVAAVAVLAAIVWRMRARPRPTPDVDNAPASAFAEIAAVVINDLASAAAGLLALALASRGQWRLLALGVLISVLASLPGALQARRSLRAAPLALAATGAVLALGMGSIALSNPTLSRILASGRPVAAYVVPIAFAAVVLWRARQFDRVFSGRRQLLGR